MGTPGYKIFRYDGRFFVFLNVWDSYPAQFGKELVDSIPVDEKGYRRWLTAQRKFFAETTEAIEKHALVLDGKQISDYLKICGLDVTRFPTGIVDLDAASVVDWTYTIDLDREIFSVWDSAHFKLDKIPRDGVWSNSLKKVERGKYTVDLDICPPECVASPEMERPRMLEEATELKSMYQALEPTIVKARAEIENGRRHAHQCFHALTYVSFCEAYFDNYARYALRWLPTEFIFRELAFVVLSLAAGKVQYAHSPFRRTEMFSSNWKESAKFEIEEGKGVEGENFVPLFPIGAHIPGQQPGSAPGDTMYWFEGVLVSLATDLDDREWLETYVAKAVKYALWFGKQSFEAVITDLLFVVLLDVQVKGNKTIVRHTMPMQLFPMNRSDHLSTHPSERPPRVEKQEPKDEEKHEAENDETNEAPNNSQEDLNTEPTTNRILVDRNFPPQGGKALLASSALYTSESNLTRYIPGFIALQNFLDKAKNRTFDRAGVGRGALPTEILNRVSDYLDYDTHCTSMQVNAAFRDYCLRHFWVHGITMLEKVEFPKAKSDGDGDQDADSPVLTFADAETGEEKRFRVHRGREGYSYRSPAVRWCPVVGEGDRRSAVQRVGQRFMAVKEER